MTKASRKTPNSLRLDPDHPDFPIEVRNMLRPPSALYLVGVLPQRRNIAIVGTRRATLPALNFTHDLAARLCRDGWSIWSGGAAGIDSAAHKGAIEAGGKTVVVMGTGFKHPYPTDNEPLFTQVIESDGCWLSLLDDNQVGTRWSFLERNELLASMVEHVIVVQAPLRSGARSTMAAARRMGKTTWAVPGAPWDNASEGCLLEIEAGATALHYAEQITGRSRPTARTPPKSLSPDERRVLDIVKQNPVHLDEICLLSGLSVATTAATALSLTLKRLLLESADGRYIINGAC